ncbi:ABC transporter ATP-binding protein [Calorimonas adulescens]|jgi:ABC transporter.|uniref:ABC transporter ATP-binding protein n=1 Tax=Calorimonas adulescens TaxID=2606906 RepID=A0A5D8QB60_9THEO|nr:ABC transporter ATP-binding protein [Calorimonas adulescens]TZE81722.1 ABC transporter ATP-binding protein [Calorimonas adulescens]
MDDVIVSMKNTSMSYHTIDGETKAIDRVTFEVKRGELFGIVGPSGCGKSTILSLISGLLKPSSGKIYVGGKVSYMLQKDYLLAWRTITQNALLGLEIQKKLTPENRENVVNMLKKYGLSDFLNHYPGQLSGGMRQRVALIRTLAVGPDILLLDEPFSALDYQTRLAIADEVWRIIKQEKKTALFVTHDISEAISMSDSILVLSKRPGRPINIHKIVTSGEQGPLNRRNAPEFRKYFNEIWRELDVHV